jgi:hypothetical protein
LSPSADPIGAQEAQGTAGQGGDAKEAEWLHPVWGGEFVEDKESVGPAGQGDDGGSAGPAPTLAEQADQRHPIVGWCEDHDVDIRQARIYLRKSFPVWFTDLRDWHDLAQLDADRVPRALAYLSAQFDQPAKEGDG